MLNTHIISCFLLPASSPINFQAADDVQATLTSGQHKISSSGSSHTKVGSWISAAAATLFEQSAEPQRSSRSSELGLMFGFLDHCFPCRAVGRLMEPIPAGGPSRTVPAQHPGLCYIVQGYLGSALKTLPAYQLLPA